jgi:PE-PPE domain
LSIALFAGASMMLLALMSMFSVPISRADNPDDALNTLMMGGTTMPTPSEGWQDAIITDYIDPATGGNYTLVLVPTPESLAPTSVPTGLADLQAAIAAQQLSDPGEPFLVEGFVPTTELPLLDPLRSLGVPESVLNIIQPELQVIVEAGYDRSIPFGDPTPAELIPSIDPVTFSSNWPTATSRAPITLSSCSAASCPISPPWKAFSRQPKPGPRRTSACRTTKSSLNSTTPSTRSTLSVSWRGQWVRTSTTCWR